MRSGFQRSFSFVMRSILAVFFWSTTGVALANEVEQTILVPPGSDSVAVDIASDSVTSIYGPFNGHLWQQGEHLIYVPTSRFAESGSDLAIVHLTLAGRTAGETVLRLRFLAGATAWDGGVAIFGDLTGAPPSWRHWTIDSMDGAPTLEPGLFGGKAYVFDTEDADGPSITTEIEDGTNSGNGTTTSTTDLDVEVRDLPGAKYGTLSNMTFFRIREGGNVIGGLDAVWVDKGRSSGWYLRPTTSMQPFASSRFLLSEGRNRVRLRRWSQLDADDGGIEVFLNGEWITELPSPPISLAQPEMHEIMLTNVPGPGDQELVVDNPIARRSGNLIDPSMRLSYNNFSGGDTSEWTVVNAAAQSFPNQDLPGPGNRFDVDLGLLSTSQSSFLEKSVPLPVGGVPDPPEFGLRLWIDPTAVSLPARSSVQVATACSESGASCDPLQIWLGHDGTSFTIAATAWRDGGSPTRIETPVTQVPHLVEVRLGHGWLPNLANGFLELRIDGVLIGRATGLDNHTAQINKLRLGVLTDAAGSSGVVGLDDFEAWRLE